MASLNAAKKAAADHIRAAEAEAEERLASTSAAHDEVRAKLVAVTDELALLEDARLQGAAELQQLQCEAEAARVELEGLRRTRSEEMAAAEAASDAHEHAETSRQEAEQSLQRANGRLSSVQVSVRHGRCLCCHHAITQTCPRLVSRVSIVLCVGTHAQLLPGGEYRAFGRVHTPAGLPPPVWRHQLSQLHLLTYLLGIGRRVREVDMPVGWMETLD